MLRGVREKVQLDRKFIRDSAENKIKYLTFQINVRLFASGGIRSTKHIYHSLLY